MDVDACFGPAKYLLNRKKLCIFLVDVVIVSHIYSEILEVTHLGENLHDPAYIVVIAIISRLLVIWAIVDGVYTIFKSALLRVHILGFWKEFDTENSHLIRNILIILLIHKLVLIAISVYWHLMFGWGLIYIVYILEYSLFDLIILFVVFLAQTIFHYLRKLNQLLELQENGIPKEEVGNCDTTEPNSLEQLVYKYEDVYDVADSLNAYFKVTYILFIFIVTSSILIHWLLILDMCLVSINHCSWYSISVSLFSILLLLGFAVLLALVGENLEEEGQITTKICYALLNKLPVNLEGKHEKLMREQLHLLANQSQDRKIRLHAGEFFQLNWGILGYIASTVATYAIVITQFAMK